MADRLNRVRILPSITTLLPPRPPKSRARHILDTGFSNHLLQAAMSLIHLRIIGLIGNLNLKLFFRFSDESVCLRAQITNSFYWIYSDLKTVCVRLELIEIQQKPI